MSDNHIVISDDPTADEMVGSPPEHGHDAVIDRLNLEQALRDFEIANRRVVDLTHRLTSIHRELVETRDELSRAAVELARTRRYVDRIRGSRLFPLVQGAARATRALRK